MAMIVSDTCAIVPAAGFGQRMQMEYPKQYLMVGNKTILEHSVSTLLYHPRIARIIVVISPNDTRFATLPLMNNPQISVVNGGAKRVDSVLAGIQEASDAKWILIHDAVRPCLHQADLIKLLTISKTSHVGGILATPVRDTIKRAKIGKTTISHTIERINLWHALTPQFFPRELLYKCLNCAINEGANIADEASALEYCGFHPQLIQGRADNIKLTHQEDLKIIECFFIKKTNQDNM